MLGPRSGRGRVRRAQWARRRAVWGRSAVLRAQQSYAHMKRHGPIWAALTPRGLAELLGCSGNPAVPHAQVLLHSHAPAKIRRSRPLLHTKRPVAACTGVFTAHNTPPGPLAVHCFTICAPHGVLGAACTGPARCDNRCGEAGLSAPDTHTHFRKSGHDRRASGWDRQARK